MATMEYFIVALVFVVSIQSSYVYGEEPTKCIECVGDETSECAKNNPNTTISEITCNVTSVKQCISYKDFDVVSQKILIYRGCANETDQCNIVNTETNTIKSCITCDTKDCIPDLSKAKESILCIQCSGDDCPDDKIDGDTKFNKFETGSAQGCVAYQYLNVTDKKVKYYRGLADSEGNNCKTQNTTVTKSCYECNNNDNCNTNFGDAKQYTLCIDCSGDTCPNNEINSDTKFTKFETGSTQGCLAYQYLDVTDKKVKYYRGLADSEKNNCKTQNTTVTKSCYECNDNDNCNTNFGDAKQYTLCIDCSGDTCPNNEINSDTKFTKFETGSTQGCVAYQYLDVTDKKVKYYRGLADTEENNCKTQNTTVTKSCYECNDNDNCNTNFGDAKQYTLCIDCSGDTCPNNEINSDTKFTKFETGSTKGCVAYQYLDVTDKKVKYYRGLADSKKNNCKTQNTTVTKSCYECNNNDNCNTNFGDAKQYTLCIDCSGDTCPNNEINSDTKFTKFETSSTKGCVAYQYLDVTDKKVKYYRGLADSKKNNCKTQNTTVTKSCYECNNNDNCNTNFGDAKQYTLCIDCSGDTCPNNEINSDTKFTKFETSSTKGCVAYQYLDVTDKKVKYYRGLADSEENNCKTQNTTVTKSCYECNDNDNCNTDFGDAKQYTLCIDCSGDTCPNNEINSDTKFTKFETGSTQGCVAYQYLDVTDKKVKYYRGLADSEKNNCKTQNTTVTKSCYECNGDDNCNTNFGDAKQYTLCIDCSGDTCPNDEINSDTKFAKFETSSTQGCVAYQYLDVTDKKVKSYRGLADSEENNCKTQNKTVTKSCYECNNDDNCNTNFGNAKQYTLCIDCSGDTCPNDEINSDTKFTKFETGSTQGCVAYQYLDVADEKIKYYRGLTDEQENNCAIQNVKSITKSCNECKDSDNCNTNLGSATQYTLCVECSGDKCPDDDVTINSTTTFCKFDTKSTQECITYSYLNTTSNSKTPVYYRGCVEKKQGCEYLSVEGHFKQGTMQECSECENTDLCNKNFNDLTTQNPETTITTESPETTTAGAPSIVNFGICLLSMVIGTFLIV